MLEGRENVTQVFAFLFGMWETTSVKLTECCGKASPCAKWQGEMQMVGLPEANISVENHLHGDVCGYEMSIPGDLSCKI